MGEGQKFQKQAHNSLEKGTLVQALKGLIKVAFQEVVTGIRDPMITMINMDGTDTKLF